MLAANQDNAGVNPAAEAIRRALAELEARCERERSDLQRALRTLEGAARMYLNMSNTDAIEQYLQDNPRKPYVLLDVVNELRKVGVRFGEGKSKRGPHAVAKGLVKQHHNPPRFHYDEDTDLISLAEEVEADAPSAAPKRRTKGRRRSP